MQFMGHLSNQISFFASPVYFWTITGVLKTVADRLYAELEYLGYKEFARESVFGGGSFEQIKTWYRSYEKNLGWNNRGAILGTGKLYTPPAKVAIRLKPV